ncbi:TraM recognition domain-containing protein [Nocardia sp. MW-W600-9]
MLCARRSRQLRLSQRTALLLHLFGGLRIILMTILQVLRTRRNLWGANGLKTMMAQSIEVYGGSIASRDYLEHWSAWPGNTTSPTAPAPTHPAVQRSLSWRAEPILDVAMLAALPKDRALVRLPGHGPVVVRKVPGSTASTRRWCASRCNGSKVGGSFTGQVEPLGKRGPVVRAQRCIDCHCADTDAAVQVISPISRRRGCCPR